MPTYDYQCRSCGVITEMVHSMLEAGPTACERCGGELRMLVHPTGIIFKGSGFYRNDSRSSGSRQPSSPAGEGTPASKPTGGSTEKGSAPGHTSGGNDSSGSNSGSGGSSDSSGSSGSGGGD